MWHEFNEETFYNLSNYDCIKIKVEPEAPSEYHVVATKQISQSGEIEIYLNNFNNHTAAMQYLKKIIAKATSS